MDVDKWLVSRFGRLTPVRISAGFPVECELGWGPEAVWTLGRKDKSLVLTGKRNTNSRVTNPLRNKHQLSYPQQYRRRCEVISITS